MIVVGNDFWWSQVRNIQEEHGIKSYREAELKAFEILYKRMKDDGMKTMEMIDHFKTTFAIGYTAFYTRLRKMGGV